MNVGEEIAEHLRQLRDPDSDVRGNAAGWLGALGRDGASAIAPLYDACRDEDMYVRGEAVHALWELAGSFGRDKESEAWSLLVAGVPALIALLDDPWWSVRCSAMSLLEALGPAAAPALPQLRALLAEKKPKLTKHPERWGLETEVRLIKESADKTIRSITNLS